MRYPDRPHASLPIYVISRDSARLEATRQALAPRALIHVPGVSGAEHRDSSAVTALCRTVCTDKIIGCALAHRNAARRIADSGVPVALVLEDDVVPVTPTLEKDVARLLDDPSWEILTVYCQGVCSNKTRVFQGSTAAYLIRATGAHKLAAAPISYHADFLRSSRAFETKVGPNLFTTRDKRDGIVVGDQSLQFWAAQHAVRLGPTDVNVGLATAFVSAALCAALFAGWTGLAAALVISVVVWCFYMSTEAGHYRCGPETALFGVVFPLAVLFRDKLSVPQVAISAAALAMLIFHILHLFDR